MSEVAGAVPFVVTVMVVVEVTTAIGILPTTIEASADCTMHDGAAAHVPLKVTTHAEAGTPLAPIVTMPAVSVPATDGDVPQFDEQVGTVVCVAASCVAPVPVPCTSTLAVVDRNFGLMASDVNVAICELSSVSAAVGATEELADVLKVILPGMLVAEIVPVLSIAKLMEAACWKFVPSEPRPAMDKSASKFWTIVCVPIEAPRDFVPKMLKALASADHRPPPERAVAAVVPCCCTSGVVAPPITCAEVVPKSVCPVTESVLNAPAPLPSPIPVQVLAAVQSCRFCPAVAFVLKKRLPTAQAVGAVVDGAAMAFAATGRLTI